MVKGCNTVQQNEIPITIEIFYSTNNPDASDLRTTLKVFSNTSSSPI